MAQSVGSDPAAFTTSLQCDVTLSQDASILTGDDSALDAFKELFRSDVSALLDVGNEIEITSMTAGSVVVGFEIVVDTAQGTVTVPDVATTLQSASIASSTVASVGETSVTFELNALALAETGTDVATALPLINTQISAGAIDGVSTDLSIFSGLMMQCPGGYYTDSTGACSRCPVDENGHAQEPNAARDGCVKCTERATSVLMSWYSPIGAQCELCPSGRAPNEKRTACEPCIDNEYSDGQGMLCTPCGMGTAPSPDRSECIACVENFFSTSGICEACPLGRYGIDSTASDMLAPVASGANSCENCEIGRTGPAAGTGCTLCEVGYYSLTTDGACKSCVGTIEMPDSRQIKSIAQPVLRDACPGGLPGVEAGVCPMFGIWIHIDSDDSALQSVVPQLLPCEADGACIEEPNCTFSGASSNALQNEQSGLIPGAICGEGNEGFMCALCKDGFTKINGSCIACSGFDWRSLATSLLVSLASAYFLLHKSTGNAVVSPEELRLIWSKVDHSEAPTNDRTRTGYGYLPVGKALGVRYGRFGKTPEQTKLLTSDFAGLVLGRRENEARLEEMGQSVMLLTGVRLTEKQKNEMMDKHFGGAGPINVDDFCRVRCGSQPTTGFAVAIFFVQTFALLAKDAGFFGFAEALNMDSEQALGACVSPLTYHQRFFSKMIITPIIMFAGVPLSEPVWNRMRRLGFLQERFAKMNLPTAIKPVHKQRGILNAFLYCFAPLTRLAIEALVCVPTCSDESEECPEVLAFDQGVRCFEGDHRLTAIIAIAVLILMAAVIPVLLIKRVQHARNQRNQSLSLKVNEVEKWFHSIDADGSGSLDRAEVKLLLQKLGESTSKSKFEANWEELDQPDENGVKNGEVSLDEFSDWYMKRVQAVPETPYGILFGAYSPSAYWWFMQVLWLKTGINMLFTFGYFGTFQWHLWVHLILATSVCLMVISEPHTNRFDYVIELFVLVSLAAVTHVSSIFKSGEDWGVRYLVATAVLALLPPMVTVGLTLHMKKGAKAHKAAAEAQRLENQPYEISDDMDWSNQTLCEGKLNLLTVSELKGIALHLKLDPQELRQAEETETLREQYINLLEEQRKKDENWQHSNEDAEGEEGDSTTALGAAASGGFLASCMACLKGGSDE